MILIVSFSLALGIDCHTVAFTTNCDCLSQLFFIVLQLLESELIHECLSISSEMFSPFVVGYDLNRVTVF